MPNIIYREDGIPLVWADETNYAGGAMVGGVRTHSLNLKNLLFKAARQGAKADLGCRRARLYAITLSVELKAAELAEFGETIDLYWGPSHSSVAATANQGGLAGTDAAYTGTAAGTLASSLEQLIKIGELELTRDVVGVPQRQTWIFDPILRYGQPVVFNNCDAEDLNSVDAEEMYVRMVGLFDSV